MKKHFFMFFTLLIFAVCAFAAAPITLTLKDGEIIVGDLICESKGRMTLKSGGGTVAVFKKSVKLVGDKNVSGAREFTLGDSLLLVNKNEVTFIITSQDAARVKLRKVLPDGSETLFGEKSGVFGDTLRFFVPDGRFYEAVQYTRDTLYYYGIGSAFEKKTRCETFSKTEIELRGFPAGQRVPQLRSDELRFKRDGE